MARSFRQGLATRHFGGTRKKAEATKSLESHGGNYDTEFKGWQVPSGINAKTITGKQRSLPI